MTEQLMEYGAVGALLLILWKTVQIVGAMIRVRVAPEPTPPAMPRHCQEQIERIAKWVDETDIEINKGLFTCSWQGRDEVRDFQAAIKENTMELRLLRKEIEKQNGGRH